MKMKRILSLAVICAMLLCGNMINAQEQDDDDVPYLSDEDMLAVETVLPFDVPEMVQNRQESRSEGTEISRLNTSQRIYHLLILDRTSCSSNADIDGINNRDILYKFKHGANGYLIALYTSPQAGPVFPQLPPRSRIIVNMMTVRKNTISEYIASNAFRRFVTNRRVISGLQEALRTN
jgi:hypothetical protein